ncbi:MAG: M28 family peptidase [Ignavibacteria bacterium]|nr:M28 family peptidase [Ignavibacteria bacterium]
MRFSGSFLNRRSRFYQSQKRPISLIEIGLCSIWLLLISLMVTENSFPQENRFDVTQQISIKNIKKHISILASDSLLGRGTGTDGARITAGYISEQLKNYGIKPFGNNGGYYQQIPLHGSYALPQSLLTIHTDSEKHELNLGDDYILLKHGEKTLISKPVDMVFAGYGISAPEFDYNDYQSIDVEGKIVLVFGGEPYSQNQKYFAGENNTIYSYPEAKHRLAIARGARGVLVIPNPFSFNETNWKRLNDELSFEDVSLPSTTSSNFLAYIHPRVANKIFSASGYNLDDLIENHYKNKLKSFPLKVNISFKGVFKEREFLSSNVIGLISGNDKKFEKTYLVLSAHYDHLGIGSAVNGDSIYNGLTDNALGVAVLLELSRLLKLSNLKRSVIVLFVTGEEKGLLGSQYFVDNSPVPVSSIVTNLNIDGVAFIDKFKDVIGLGSEYSDLNKILLKIASPNNIEVSQIPNVFEQVESFYKSDQLSFAKAGIPSINIIDAPHYENYSEEESILMIRDYFENIYHSPFDDLNQKLNWEAILQHTKILFDFSIEVTNSEKEPEWNDDSPFMNIRLRSKYLKK